jgi:hypothetical protein
MRYWRSGLQCSKTPGEIALWVGAGVWSGRDKVLSVRDRQTLNLLEADDTVPTEVFEFMKVFKGVSAQGRTLTK